MTSIKYDEICSDAFTRMEAYNFLTMSKEMVRDNLASWMHSISAKPYVRRAFESLVLDDETQTLSWEIKYPIDDYSDEAFVKELFSLGISMKWAEREKNRSTLTRQMVGSTKQKFYSQSNQLDSISNLYENIKKELQQLIGDKNSSQNGYINEYSK